MSVAELSAAAIAYSDNTAANLLLHSLGGPAQLTRYLRTLGDTQTRLDRTEPTLNSNLADDARDTTTPQTMLATMHRLLLGDALSPASREQLVTWLVGNTTGDKKLRASFDPSWKVGDKTGSGSNGASNDVAIVWPPNRDPFLIAVYTTGSASSADAQSAVIAQVGRIVADAFETQHTPSAPLP